MELLDAITKIKFERFMNDNDEQTKNLLKQDIELLLYNKRNITINTKKLQQLNNV